MEKLEQYTSNIFLLLYCIIKATVAWDDFCLFRRTNNTVQYN